MCCKRFWTQEWGGNVSCELFTLGEGSSHSRQRVEAADGEAHISDLQLCLDLCFAILIMLCWSTKTNNIIKISKYMHYILLTSARLVHSFSLGSIWSILVYLVQIGLLSPFISAQSYLVQQCLIRSFRSTMVHSITSVQFDPLWSTPFTLVH